jgi:hypothetical protein
MLPRDRSYRIGGRPADASAAERLSRSTASFCGSASSAATPPRSAPRRRRRLVDRIGLRPCRRQQAGGGSLRTKLLIMTCGGPRIMEPAAR